ncbi:MAG: hypothetical protein MSIBF_03550 [Candidatus Altiarchaeales archaeon IMC4]|nr:MAG: hypothetical protein MSIBF_03550 [Candidatus Altiarchaeales archaeon IMC4]
MYEKLNITENHLQVLSLFTKGFDRGHYIREVQKLLKISPRTAQLILDTLEKKAVIESKTMGKIKMYKLKKNMITREYLIITEEYKKISFLEKNPIISNVIEKITPCIRGVGVVFGSYAKGTQKENSDIDIFIAGEYDKDEIDEISELYGVNISVKRYPLETFKRGIGSDVLLKEIAGDHIVISQVEDFINIVVQ